ncbi:unnamed protein product [Urochloa humidicola]
MLFPGKDNQRVHASCLSFLYLFAYVVTEKCGRMESMYMIYSTLLHSNFRNDDINANFLTELNP